MRNSYNFFSCIFPAIIVVLLLSTSSSAQDKTPLIPRPEKFHAIIPHDATPELVVDGSQSEAGLSMTEGPSWLNGKLYFSNYYSIGRSIKLGIEGFHVLNSDGSYKVLNTAYRTCGTTPLPNGNIAACCFSRPEDENSTLAGIIELTPDGELVKVLADSYDGEPFEGNPNDLITDSKGGIYFTVNSYPKDKSNVVFYLNPQGKVIKVTEFNEFPFPNGCVLSADGSKFYLSISGDIIVWEYDVNNDGSLSNKQVFSVLRYPESPIVFKKNIVSFADGMTLDRLGNIYVTSQVGIQVFDRFGLFLGVIEVPILPSHCVFGGSDLSTLYITGTSQIYSIQTHTQGFQYPIK